MQCESSLVLGVCGRLLTPLTQLILASTQVNFQGGNQLLAASPAPCSRTAERRSTATAAAAAGLSRAQHAAARTTLSPAAAGTDQHVML